MQPKSDLTKPIPFPTISSDSQANEPNKPFLEMRLLWKGSMMSSKGPLSSPKEPSAIPVLWTPGLAWSVSPKPPREPCFPICA